MALATAEKMGIDAEVIDLRTLRPLDTETIIESVKKTNRLACVYEGVKTLGIGVAVGVVCCLTAMERRRAAMPEHGQLPIGFMRSVLAVLLVSGLVSVL